MDGAVNDSGTVDTHTWTCAVDPARAPDLNSSGAPIQRCIETCPQGLDSECVTGNVCQGGYCMEGIIPPQACVNAPQRYEIDGAEQYRIQMAIDDAGLDLGAIYHSHTRSAPFPSQTDINLAFYPEALYVIVGVAGDEPEVRAFRIRDGQVAEEQLQVG